MADLNSLVMFAKVVEANSFSEAARRLKMPISTVSRRIAELEDQLGIRLLERSTRNLRLTELGAEVLEHALRSAELSEAIESIVSNRLSSVSGTLRLSAPPSISDGIVTFVGFTCQLREALAACMSKFQCLRELVAPPNRLENRLFLVNVTMPLRGIASGLTYFEPEPSFSFARTSSMLKLAAF
jgi:DNA-binding transcriptional LysR family regulator